MAKKRSPIEVKYHMLHAVREKGGKIKPTHMMYKANLSHGALRRHIDDLKGSGLIEEVNIKERREIHLTEKGYHFIEEYQRLRVLADAFGL